MPDKVRIDKWLWSVRAFKTRSQASEACRSGKVRVNGEQVKPSFLVEIDQEVTFRKERREYIFLVKKLIVKRVSASLAIECYEDNSPPGETLDMKFVWERPAEQREKGEGRPTKKDRRNLDDWKNI